MKVVLAYSGGLDTSVLVRWIKDYFNAEVITFAADVGQEEELEGLAEKAKATGASAHYTVDLKDEFAKDFIFPMMRANALYESQYFLGTSIARPLIAKAHVEIARAENATHLAHGATGKGNDQCRFEISYAALAPDLQVISPWRMPEFRKAFPGRSEMIEYCKSHGINVQASAKKPYSMVRNMLHISYEAGILEDPWFDPTVESNKDMFKLTADPVDAPNEPEYIELEFANGDCVAIDGKKMTPAEVMRRLNKLAGKHGIGRVDLVENRFVGMKSRGVYETPGGTILMFAHRQIETLTMDRDLMHLRDSLVPKYAELIYNGFWFAPEREALQAFIDKSQENVSGVVRLKLYKGNTICVGRKSDKSLYDENIASMEGVRCDYNPDDASGFIHLNSLRLRQRALKQGVSKEAFATKNKLIRQ
ncbi:MAG: argininosuccinate synthase [Opitutales bacterium]|nr:argininosuccinate synthase [Opitutales bacterium]